MARIEGPSTRRLIESISEKQVEAPTVDATPMLPPPAPGLMGPLPPSSDASGFADFKPKKVRMSGAFRGGPAQPREPIAAFQVRPGVTAETGKGTLQVKGGDAKAETKGKKTPNDFMEKVGAMKPAEKKALEKQIAAGKGDPLLTAAYLSSMSDQKERAALMQKLSPAQLGQLSAIMKEGNLPESVALGVGVQLAATSNWGKAHPEVVKTMQNEFAAGNIRIAQKDSDIAGLGMTSAAGIDLGAQLRNAPEALAATIAHEAVHKHDGNGGCCGGTFDATPGGELKGMQASAEIWAQLNPGGTDKNLDPKAVKLLNDVAAARGKGEKEFKNVVLGYYTNFYQKKIEGLETAVTKGDARYKQLADKNKRMPSEELDRLMDNKSQLEYLRKTEKAFYDAWMASQK